MSALKPHTWNGVLVCSSQFSQHDVNRTTTANNLVIFLPASLSVGATSIPSVILDYRSAVHSTAFKIVSLFPLNLFFLKSSFYNPAVKIQSGLKLGKSPGLLSCLSLMDLSRYISMLSACTLTYLQISCL